MDFFDKMLKEARNEKFETIEEKRKDLYTCNHSEGDGCVACTHPNMCIFDEKRIELEKKEAECHAEINELKKVIEDSKKQIEDYQNKLKKIKNNMRCNK